MNYELRTTNYEPPLRLISLRRIWYNDTYYTGMGVHFLQSLQAQDPCSTTSLPNTGTTGTYLVKGTHMQTTTRDLYPDLHRINLRAEIGTIPFSRDNFSIETELTLAEGAVNGEYGLTWGGNRDADRYFAFSASPRGILCSDQARWRIRKRMSTGPAAGASDLLGSPIP